MKFSWCWSLLALVTLGCNLGSPADPGRMSLALSGQFVTGELTSLDVFIYEGAGVECDAEAGTLSNEPSANVDSQTNISLSEPTEIAFSLPTGVEYVVYARAGRRDGGELDIVARGCETIALSRQAQVSVFLHRIDSCGDGDVDPQEMCDGGDGCDGQCRTQPFFVNDVRDFREDRQELPLAAGHEDRLAVCWRSQYTRSQQAPMAWFDSDANDGEPFLQNLDWNARNCTSVDVHGDHVLMTYFLGTGLPRESDGELMAFVGQDPTEPVEIGARADLDLQAVFTGYTEFVTLSQTSGGFELREAQMTDGVISVGGTTYPVDEASPDATAPAIAGGDGNFLVAWEDGNDVMARFFNDIDRPTSTIDLCTESSSCSSPAVASLRGLSGNQFLVVYIGSNDRVVGRFVNLQGNESVEFEISTEGNCREPVVEAFDKDRHEYLVAWTQATDGGAYPARIYARFVTDVDTFGQMATGSEISDQPFLVSPESGVDADQPAIATSFETSAPANALVFYRSLQGIDDGTDWDIGARLLRAARIPDDG